MKEPLQVLIAGLMLIIGMLAGGYLAGKGSVDRCEKHGFTHINGVGIKCEVVKENP